MAKAKQTTQSSAKSPAVANTGTTATTTRKNTVSREQIALRAYEIFQARGGHHGNDVQDWLQAEAELGLGRQ
jgi:hypothetical protein